MVVRDDDDGGDDGPTERIEELSDDDWQTIRASLAALGPALADMPIDEGDDDIELPTMRVEAAHHERTVELTVDALPAELRHAALPFLEERAAPRHDPPRPPTLRLAEDPASRSDQAASPTDDRASFAAIAAELERGETGLRDAFDDAFLAKRARHRGAFDLAAIASLRAAVAAGAPRDPLDLADALRVRRVALRRRAIA